MAKLCSYHLSPTSTELLSQSNITSEKQAHHGCLPQQVPGPASLCPRRTQQAERWQGGKPYSQSHPPEQGGQNRLPGGLWREGGHGETARQGKHQGCVLESPSSQAKHEGLRTWELGDWTSSTRRGKTYRKHINCRGSCQELPSGGCLGPDLMLSLSKCSPCLPSWTRLFMQTSGSQKGLGWKERYRSSKSTSPHHGQEQFFGVVMCM